MCCNAPQAYSNNLVDHHLILDLLPGLAAAFFAGHLPASMSLAQAAILLAMVTPHLQCTPYVPMSSCARDHLCPCEMHLSLCRSLSMQVIFIC